MHVGDKKQGSKKSGAKRDGLRRGKRNQEDVEDENMKGYVQPTSGRTYLSVYHSALTHQPLVNMGDCVFEELVCDSTYGTSEVSTTM